MKIKDTLDLCGWELWNFCIQNHQNLEGLLDLGAGRKVFYTGNDQGKNGREVIYDGSKWKVSAYTSDVDELRGLITALENATDEEIEALKGRATTTEGNLATLRSEFDALNKALNDDTAGVIDTWQEVVDFVNEYSGSQDLSTILAGMNTKIDGKLNLSGGTITVENIGGFNVYNKTQSLSAVHFYALVNNVRTDIGYLGISAENGPVYLNSGGTQYTLLHSGNIGKYALKNLGYIIDVPDSDTPLKSGDAVIIPYFQTWGGQQIGSYRLGAIRMSSGTSESQLVLDHYYGNIKYRNYGESSWSDWKTIAFTDSNVASAKTLQNIYDYASLDNTQLVSNFGITSYGLRLYGKDLYLQDNKGYKFIINTSGNVTIGSQDYAGTSAKLYVDGATIISAIKNSAQLPTLGNVGGGGHLIVGNSNLGLELWTRSDGHSAMQAHRHTGTAEAFNLMLQPLGGNILVGANADNGSGAKVQIKGDLYVEGNIIATKEVSAGGAATEGNGGAGGFSLYESWGTSAPTEPLALGANLGYELKTRVEDLELAKTKVEISDTLVSGKPIGAITIDGNKTNLFAPATYAWSEITGTENVLLKSGGTIASSDFAPLVIKRNDTNGVAVRLENKNGLLGNLGIAPNASGAYPFFGDGTTNYTLYHTGNFTSSVITTALGYTPVNSIGGVMSNPYGTVALTINSDNGNDTATSGTYLIIQHKGSKVGEVGHGWNLGTYILANNHTLRIANDGVGYVDNNTLLHSGNVGEYKAGDSYKLGGLVASRYLYAINLDDDTYDFKQNFTATNTPFIGRLGDSTQHPNLPDARLRYGNVLHVSVNGKDTAWELVAGHGNNLLMFRSGTWKADGTGTINSNAWKTIAFTDSDITGNAAGLHQKNDLGNYYIKPDTYGFSLEGQYATLKIKTTNIYNSQIEFADPNDIVRWALSYRGTNKADKDFCFTKLNEDGTGSHIVTLNYSSGNVLIGTTTDNGAKLQVKGDVKLLSNASWQTEYTTISAIGVAYYGRTAGGYYQGAYFYDYNKAELAFAGAYADTEGLTYYVIGKNYSLPWFTINAEYSEFKVLTSFAAGAKVSFLEVNSTSAFYGSTTFGKEGVSMQVNFKCPVVAEDRVTIGGATLRWDDEIKALRLNTSLAATGELSAGGAGTEGGNTGGGGTGTIASPFSRTFTPNEKTSFTFSHDLPYYDVVVQVYEWDNSGMCWNMVLADIEIQNNDVTVTLGRKENVEHKIVVR